MPRQSSRSTRQNPEALLEPAGRRRPTFFSVRAITLIAMIGASAAIAIAAVAFAITLIF